MKNNEVENIKNEVKNFLDQNKNNEDQELENQYGNLILKSEINGENILHFRTNLTGNDVRIVKQKYEREFKKTAKLLAEMDDMYFILMAERMTGIPYEKFLDLPIFDYNKVRNHVRDFLGEE